MGLRLHQNEICIPPNNKKKKHYKTKKKNFHSLVSYKCISCRWWLFSDVNWENYLGVIISLQARIQFEFFFFQWNNFLYIFPIFDQFFLRWRYHIYYCLIQCLYIPLKRTWPFFWNFKQFFFNWNLKQTFCYSFLYNFNYR